MVLPTIPEHFVQCCTAEIGHSHQGVLLLLRSLLICSNIYVGGMCQSNIHMNARTQVFLEEYYPEHHTVSFG